MSINFNASKSALRAADTRLGVSANNLANAATPGYRAQKAQQATLPANGGSEVHDVFQLSQRGPIKATENPFDLTIDGDGAIPIKTPSGKVEFTRSASFHENEKGQLVDKHGNQLVIDKIAEEAEVGHGVSNLSVAKDGLISGINHRQDSVILGRLQAAMATGGGIRYVTPGTNGAGKIISGALEGSNTDIATEMTDQMQISAEVKANSKTIQTQDEMVGTVLDLMG